MICPFPGKNICQIFCLDFMKRPVSLASSTLIEYELKYQDIYIYELNMNEQPKQL